MPRIPIRFRLLAGLLTAGMVLASAVQSHACTTFLNQQKTELRIGKSYDWDLQHGLVLLNKKGVKKKALLLDPREVPATWTSKYANLTFNQYGREMPNGGMNTEGLVVEIMWLSGSRVPEKNALPAITELQWIQYMLDNAATVKEAMALAPTLRVSRVHGDVHYLICDKAYQCAAFEYLNGELVISYGEDLPVPALANHTYAESMKFYAQYRKNNEGESPPKGMGSLNRFVRAGIMAAAHHDGDITAHTFDVLDSVRNGTYTKWQIVYDPMNLEIAFRTLDSPAIKTLSFDGLSHSCGDPVLMMDLNEQNGGSANPRLQPYQRNQNFDIVQKGIGSLGNAFGPELITLLSRYPESLICVNP